MPSKRKMRASKMKLKLRPNNIDTKLKLLLLLATLAGCCCCCLQLQTLAAQQVGQPESPAGQHALHDAGQHNQSQLEVQDLSLAADFRAVKLSWRYERDGGQPAAFLVRFCELTSWNIEIKCRHKDMQVEPAASSPSSSVIHTHGHQYEAQIFDLRALTNYTFQVQVSRFSHQPARGQAGRLLRNLDDSQRGQLIETKPFKAEATKCLAGASEVLVHTGRFFGGRISVEDSNDARCSLLGNRSSEQTSYLFHIDHQVCASKVVDGKRIETMVLVHENKDILTHNTARFLMLCNFMQKSFTLRASISLPKVQGLLRPSSRPALIAALPGKPSSAADQQPVMLGSMPGFYRARAASSNEIEPARQTDASSSSSKNEVDADLAAEPSQRVGKLVAELPVASERGRARALSLSSSSSKVGEEKGDRWPVMPPPPVQVQSQLLFVERPESRAARQRQLAATWLESAPAEQQQVAPSEQLKQLHHWKLPADEQQAVVKTNNHRVSADLAAGSHANAPKRSRPSSPAADYTIKYSAAEVSDYAVGHHEDERPANGTRTRNGRMRAATELPVELMQPAESAAVQHRMGDEARGGQPEQVELGGQQPNGSLAQNLTSYLLKWSLKTLTNLARKSLESLADARAPDQEFADSEPLDQSNQTAKPTSTTAAKPADAPDSPHLIPPPTTTVSSGAAGLGSTTRRPTSSESSTRAVKVEQAPRSLEQRATGKLAESLGAASDKLELQTSTSSPRTRPANYSKSLDLSRELAPQKTQTVASERTKVNASAQRIPLDLQLHHNHQHQEPVAKWTESDKDQGGHFGGWLLCSLAVSSALVVGVFVTLWLLPAPSSPRQQVVVAAAAATQANQSHTFNQKPASQQRFDYGKLAASQHHLLAAGKAASSSSSRSSAASNSTWLVADDSAEHNCRNNEFLFTDHVLIDTGSTLQGAESYA